MASHLTCAQFLTGHGLSLWRAANILAGDFALSRSATDRRRDHLQELAEIGAYVFQPLRPWDQDSVGALPRLLLERTRQIIQSCLSYIMISHGIFSPEGIVSQPASYLVNLQGPIWAGFVSFQGNYYVSRISNTPIDGILSILTRPSTKVGSTIYVSHDHLGVRRVVFAVPESRVVPKVEEKPGLWWETINLTDDCQYIEIESDVRRYTTQHV
jgi:hypothetical protein